MALTNLIASQSNSLGFHMELWCSVKSSGRELEQPGDL